MRFYVVEPFVVFSLPLRQVCFPHLFLLSLELGVVFNRLLFAGTLVSAPDGIQGRGDFSGDFFLAYNLFVILYETLLGSEWLSPNLVEDHDSSLDVHLLDFFAVMNPLFEDWQLDQPQLGLFGEPVALPLHVSPSGVSFRRHILFFFEQ